MPADAGIMKRRWRWVHVGLPGSPPLDPPLSHEAKNVHVVRIITGKHTVSHDACSITVMYM